MGLDGQLFRIFKERGGRATALDEDRKWEKEQEIIIESTARN